MISTALTRDDWIRLRAAFDRIVEIPDEAREAALAGLPPEIPRAMLERMLTADRSPFRRCNAPLSVPADALAIDGLEDLHLVARGGMADVYRGCEMAPRRIVAVKVLARRLLASEMDVRFRRESQILAQLTHPGIVRVFRTGEIAAPDGSVPYQVTEWVEDAQSIVSFAAGRSLEERLELLRAVCEAIHAAHERGIIHRDLKPGNILVGRDGRPRVIDFGIAHLADAQDPARTLTADHGRILGTLAYMSPEQAAGRLRETDARTDVWSLGAILFELLAGRPPRVTITGDVSELLRSIIHDEPAPLHSVVPGLPRDLSWIVGKAMALEPDRRYPTAAALAADIGRFRAQRPIEARPPTTSYRLGRLLRRHRTATTISLGAAVAVGIALTAAGMALSRAGAHARAAGFESYKASITKASSALDRGATGEAQRLLVDLAGRSDALHGFESGMLMARADESQGIFSRRGFARRSIEVDRTRTKFVTACRDGIVRLADAQTGANLIEHASIGQLRAACIGHDGTLLTASDEGDVAVIRPRGSSKPSVVATLGAITCAGAAAGGELLAVGDATGRVIIVGPDGVRSILASPGGVRVGAVAVSVAGDRVVAGLEDGHVVCWSPHDAAGESAGEIVGSHDGAVRAAAWCSAGDTFATGSAHGSVYVWGGSMEPTVLAHDDAVLSLAFSSDGTRLATGTQHGVIRIWTVGGELLAVLHGHEAEVLGLAFARGDQQLLSASGEGVIRSWDAGDPQAAMAVRLLPTQGDVAALRPDGGAVAVGDRGANEVTLANPVDGGARHVLHGQGDGPITALCFSADGARVAFVTRAGAVHVHDARTGASIHTFHAGDNEIECMAISPEGTLVVCGGDDPRPSVLEVATGRAVVQLQAGTAPITAICWSADGERIAAGDSDFAGAVFDSATGARIARLRGHNHRIGGIAFTADSQRVLTASMDETVRLWDARTGDELSTVHEDVGPVFNVMAIGNDRAITVAHEGRLRLWAVQGSPPRLDSILVFGGDWRGITTASAAVDGSRLLFAARDRSVRIVECRPSAVRGRRGGGGSASLSEGRTR